LGEVAKLHHTVPQFYLRGSQTTPSGSTRCGYQEIRVTPRSSKTAATHHFFDTVYPSLDHVAGRPYGLWVHGNNDTVGATTAVEKVARWGD
jgi:hypothetical protein